MSELCEKRDGWFSNHRNLIAHLFDVATQIGSGRLKHRLHTPILKNHILYVLEEPTKSCNCSNEEEHAYFIILVRLFLDYIEKREIIVEGDQTDYNVLVERFSKIAENENEYLTGVVKTNELLDIWDEFGLDLKSDMVQDAIAKTDSILPIMCLLLEHAEKYKIPILT
jgi:hypothetical protein